MKVHNGERYNSSGLIGEIKMVRETFDYDPHKFEYFGPVKVY